MLFSVLCPFRFRGRFLLLIFAFDLLALVYCRGLLSI